MSFFPLFVSGGRLADSLFADAYESSQPQERGWIKSTLAFVSSVYGTLPSRVATRIERRSSGFGVTYRHTEVPWAMLVLEPPYVSPVRLAAAVMVARVSGIEPLFGVWLGKSTMPRSLLLSLELTGVEPVFALSGSQIQELLWHISKYRGRGRVLYLGGHAGEHAGEHAVLVKRICCDLDIPVWEDSTQLTFGITPETSLDTEALVWAHPDVRLVAADKNEYGLRLGALYCGAEEKHPAKAPLVLLPGLEGVWIHQDLDPSFFRNTESRVDLLPCVNEQDSDDDGGGA